MIIKFKSTDDANSIQIMCLSNNMFSTVEGKLYQKNPELNQSNKIFLYNGNKIQKNKSLRYNRIKNNSTILIVEEVSQNIH